MTDTYSEQIEAILAGDVERFIAALGPMSGENKQRIREGAVENGLYFSAWGHTPHVKTCLFANLPRCCYCPSEIEDALVDALVNEASRATRFYELIHKDSAAVLSNPDPQSKPTSEDLNEFARRQRLCRAA